VYWVVLKLPYLLKTTTGIQTMKKPTLTSIVNDLHLDDTECLYLATEQQIDKLIAAGRIHEDYSYIAYGYRVEMEIMLALN
tara:strand:+ start:1460 stop:1702 length:243 start_codon:yes stop_codon:yes gene_type:complete